MPTLEYSVVEKAGTYVFGFYWKRRGEFPQPFEFGQKVDFLSVDRHYYKVLRARMCMYSRMKFAAAFSRK